LLVLAVAAKTPWAFAANATWTGNVDAQWSDVNNWDGPPAAVPGTGDTATFNGAGNGNTVIDLGLGITLKTLLFDTADAAAYTIGAGAPGDQSLTLASGGAVTVNSTVSTRQTLSAGVTLNGATSITVSSPSNGLSVTGTITGSGNLTKYNVGYLYLNGDNTFSGGVSLGNGTTANTSGSGVASAGSSGYVVLGHNNALGTGTVTAKGAQIWAGVPGLVITNSIVTGNSALRFGGPYDLTLAGPLTLDASRGIGNYSGSSTLTLAGPLHLGGYTATLQANDGAGSNGTTLFAGPISGSGTITMDNNYDNGRVIISGDNTSFSGDTTVNTGTLTLLHTNAVGTTGSLTLGNTDAKLELGDGVVLTRTLTVSNTGNNKILRAAPAAAAEYAGAVNVGETAAGNFDLVADAGSALTVSGGIVSTNGAGVTKLGEGFVILTGSNTVSGTVVLGNAASNVSGTDTATAGSGGFLVVCHSNAFGEALVSFKGAQLRAGVPGLVIANPFSIDQGSIRFSGTNDLELTGDAPLANGAARGFGNYSGRSTLTFRGTITTTNGWALIPQANNGAATNGTTRFLGPIDGDGTFQLDASYDNGLVVFGGANAFSGTTVLEAGTLQLDYDEQDNSKLSDTASLDIRNATLDLSGGTHLERVASTSVGGLSTVTRSSGSAILALGDLTVGGVLQLTSDDIASTTSTNESGILPNVAVQSGGRLRFAANSGVSDGGDGFLIRAVEPASVGIDRLGGVIPNDAALSAAIVNGGTAGNVTLTDPTNAVNALTMEASDGPAVIDMADRALSLGYANFSAIRQTAEAGTLSIGTAENEGALIPVSSGVPGTALLSVENDSAANALTINSTLQNNGATTLALRTAGDGTVILAGNNTFSGGTTISAGTLQIGNGGGNGWAGAGTVLNDGVLSFARGAGSSDLTVNPSIVGSGRVIQDGAANSRVTLRGGASGYTGGTTVNGGILRAEDTAGDTALLNLGTGPVTLNGGTLELRANGGGSDRTIVTGDGATGNDIFVSASATINGNLYSGTSNLRNTYRFNNLTLGGSQLTYSGGYQYRCSFAGTVTLTNDVTVNTTLDNTAAWLAFDGPVVDDGTPRSIYKTGLGSLLLNGDNTYSGGTTLGNVTANTVDPASTTASSGSGGFVLLGHNNALGTGPVLMRGCQLRAAMPGLVIPNDVVITNGGFRFGGTNALAFSGTFTLVSAARDIANYTGNQTLTLNNIDLNGQNATFVGTSGAAANGNTVVRGRISNAKAAGAVYAKTAFPNGRLILAGTNTYSTATIIESQATIQLGDGGATGSLKPASDIQNSGTLAFNRSDVVIQGADFDGLLSGSGRVSVEGTGTVVFTGTNTYSGATMIAPGATLQLGSGSTFASLNINSPMTVDGTLAFNRSDTVTQGTHFAAAVEGAGGLRQAGSGTLVLTGANAYTGTTSAAAGTLLINGDQSLATGAVTILSGATLGGTGTSGGPVTAQPGGILSPGGGVVGTLTVGALTLLDGAVYRWDVSASTNDAVQITADLTLPSAFTLDVHRPALTSIRNRVLFRYGGAYSGPETVSVTATGDASSLGLAVHDADNKQVLLQWLQTGTLLRVQ
jgi:autotransporter-associated beta strand protein